MKQEADKASEVARVLDNETQALLASVRKKNALATVAFVVCWSILLLVGILGIYRQNQLATANQKHIDCIVKLLATPSHSGQTRRIFDLSTCQIKVSP